MERNGRSKFRGRYDHTLDDKGRLSFPSRFREVIRQYASEVLIAIPWETHLRIYPLSEWEIIENKLSVGETELSEDLDKIIRFFESESSECVLDKQGRVLLPPALRAALGLKRDVVLIGMIDRVEIWDKEIWDVERQVNREHFDALKASRKKKGIICQDQGREQLKPCWGRNEFS